MVVINIDESRKSYRDDLDMIYAFYEKTDDASVYAQQLISNLNLYGLLFYFRENESKKNQLMVNNMRKNPLITEKEIKDEIREEFIILIQKEMSHTDTLDNDRY